MLSLSVVTGAPCNLVRPTRKIRTKNSPASEPKTKGGRSRLVVYARQGLRPSVGKKRAPQCSPRRALAAPAFRWRARGTDGSDKPRQRSCRSRLRRQCAALHRPGIQAHSLGRCSPRGRGSRLQHESRPLPPVLLGEIRALGFPLFLSCPGCNHSGEVAIEAFDGLPDELDIHDIGHAVRCTKCGRRGGASAHPSSRLWVA